MAEIELQKKAVIEAKAAHKLALED